MPIFIKLSAITLTSFLLHPQYSFNSSGVELSFFFFNLYMKVCNLGYSDKIVSSFVFDTSFKAFHKDASLIKNSFSSFPASNVIIISCFIAELIRWINSLGDTLLLPSSILSTNQLKEKIPF